MITDVNVNKLHQPWRSFAAVINKCLSGKSTEYDSLRLSQAQIFWGMYHKKNVDYAYLLWEDFVYQVENKNVKKSNEMYYPRFTKVIVNFFMTKDQSIPRRNSVNWHYARDDYMFTTIKVVSRHEDTQLYGAILPNELTNEDIGNSESYKEYYDIASGAEPPKTKASVKKKQVGSDKTTTPPKGKRLKTSAKTSKPAKKKQPVKTSMDKGLTVLSEVALPEAEQLKLVIERSKTHTHSSHVNGSGADEGTGAIPGVPDVPTYNSDDEQISWKFSDEEDDDEDDDDQEHDDQDDDANDDAQDKDDQDDENQDDDNEQTDSDNNVQTPSHVVPTDDEEVQGVNIEGEKMDEEANNEEKDTHVIITLVIPEGQQQSSSMSSGFVSNLLNLSPDTGIDSLFTESPSLVDVLVNTIVKPPLLSTTTLPSPPTPLITHMQQTSVPTPKTVLSSSLQDLPNFGSLFGFDHKLKTLETDFSEFKQTNQFAEAVSSISSIVDAYLANKMHEAVKIVVQLQSERLRDEAQAENVDFLNKLDNNIKKIIKDQVKEQVKAQVSKILPKIEKTVNEQLKAEVMTRSSTESKTSLPIAANLSKLELKKILIEKMESNKSIHRSVKQKNLYKALVDAYKSDKLILDTYGDTVSFKRRRDDEDKDEEPYTGSNRGEDPRASFNELMDTPLDFSAFVMNRLKVDTLTPELLACPAFELMKGTCKSLVELEYFFEEVYKTTTDQLDWHNPEGQQYPHDLRKTLTLKPNSCGRQVIMFDHFINNDLAYLSVGVSSSTYATFVTKTKAADYGHIKWIEDLVPNKMWSEVPVNYDKHALWGISHWGCKRQQFYGFAANRESASDVYSKHRIIVVTKLQIVTKRSSTLQSRIHKKNKLLRIDELHKFSDGTLDDVQTALNDRLKGIRMEYLPETIWRQSDRVREKAMIQAIKKMLKSRRIMRSLERFVGGRPYGDKMDSMHSTLSMYYDYDAHVEGELLVMMKKISKCKSFDIYIKHFD
ncbi:hypothetical protein Tco_0636102 [Tanacetum coccineum]